MTGHALVDALTDFGSATRRPSADPMQPPIVDPVEEAVQAFDYAAALAGGIAEAEAALAERLAAEYGASVAEMESRHATELASIQTELGKQAAAIVNKRLDAMCGQISASTAAIAARVLGTMVTDDLSRRSIEALSATIGAALEDREAVRIRVRGAPALCEALRESIGARADQVDFAPGDGFDLTVTIDESILETRLGEWAHALTEVLA
jgi:uncharacterized protein YunC (DUF1805 family)